MHKHCIRTLTVWTCEFACKGKFHDLDTAGNRTFLNDQMPSASNREPDLFASACRYAPVVALRSGPATRFETLALATDHADPAVQGLYSLRKTCMRETGSRVVSSDGGKAHLAAIAVIRGSHQICDTYPSSLQQHSTPTRHITQTLEPGSKPPTLKRGAPSPHLCTLGSSSEPHLPLAVGTEFPRAYPTLLAPKPAFDHQPHTNSILTHNPPNTPQTPHHNGVQHWSPHRRSRLLQL